MLRSDITSILAESQRNYTRHQRNLKQLLKVYHKSSQEEFIKEFNTSLQTIFLADVSQKNNCTEKCLDFCAKFSAAVTIEEESENLVDTASFSESDNDSSSQVFLYKVIKKTLKYTNLKNVEARHNSCKFIALVLQHIGNDVHLRNKLCNKIQKEMLLRMDDAKVFIRLQAISALVRLQEPLNPDCPVIRSYLSKLNDSNSDVRAQIISYIAPTAASIQRIKDKVREVNPKVRLAAFRRCGDLLMHVFRIVDRQFILSCGFVETENNVRQVFENFLLTKWLSYHKGNYLDLFISLTLDTSKNDITNTMDIYKNLMEIFSKKHGGDKLIEFLPLDDDRLVPIEQLKFDVVLYWRNLLRFLKEDHMDQIVPELTAFTKYIEKIIESKCMEKMDNMQLFVHEYILLYLFEMTNEFDLSDEMGRRNLCKLAIGSLQHHKFNFQLTKELVTIVGKCISDNFMLMEEIFGVISDIREQLVDKPMTQDQIIDRDFRLAELKVKMLSLEDRRMIAIENEEFHEIVNIDEQINKCVSDTTKLKEGCQNEKIKMTREDDDTICRCLDILIATLQLSNIKSVTAHLLTCRDEFILPLITKYNIEIHLRVLKCLVLFAILDKNFAKENVKVITLPIASYRANQNRCNEALIVSISGLSDLLRTHGIGLFGDDEANSNQNGDKRRLYSDDTDGMSNDLTKITPDSFVNILLDMLEDECDEIKDVSITVLTKLVLNKFILTPKMVSKIILKWYNPLTANENKLQLKLGQLIKVFTTTVRGFRDAMEKSFIPTLSKIITAPRSSPLSDIDLDNLMKFYAVILQTDKKNSNFNPFAISLCKKMLEDPQSALVFHLTKMLLLMDLTADDNLINQIELLLQEVSSKLTKKHLEQILAKQKSTNRETVNECQSASTSTMDQGHNSESCNSRSSLFVASTPKPTQQVKRKKHRRSKNEEVDNHLIESEDSRLHTVSENNCEIEQMDCDEEMSESSSKNMDSERDLLVISESSSDTDSSSGGRSLRKSLRLMRNNNN